MTALAHPRHRIPLRDDPTGPARRARKRSLDVTDRLTGRDRWLLLMLAEHRVLTTTHITDLAFGTTRNAERRLLILYRFGLVDRFRPFTPTGSAPWHYLLTPAGAAHLDEAALVETGYQPKRAFDVAGSPTLAHTVGTTSVFTRLARVARTTPGTRLETWWPEHRCAVAWDGLARPDGHGVWAEHNRRVAFFIEYDTGTEPLHRLVTKLADYTRLATTTGLRAPVLFWLPNTRRETHLHELLPDPAVPVATTTPETADHPNGPAGPVWLPTNSTGPRRRLVDLDPAQPPPCAGSGVFKPVSGRS